MTSPCSSANPADSMPILVSTSVQAISGNPATSVQLDEMSRFLRAPLRLGVEGYLFMDRFVCPKNRFLTLYANYLSCTVCSFTSSGNGLQRFRGLRWSRSCLIVHIHFLPIIPALLLYCVEVLLMP